MDDQLSADFQAAMTRVQLLARDEPSRFMRRMSLYRRGDQAALVELALTVGCDPDYPGMLLALRIAACIPHNPARSYVVLEAIDMATRAEGAAIGGFTGPRVAAQGDAYRQEKFFQHVRKICGPAGIDIFDLAVWMDRRRWPTNGGPEQAWGRLYQLDVAIQAARAARELGRSVTEAELTRAIYPQDGA